VCLRVNLLACGSLLARAFRYVLTPPNSTQFRIPAGGSGFANLVVAGDWTKNGIDAGCAEAASTSGMLASQHISGYPRRIKDYTDQL